jgi:hypothetical protein
MLQPHSLLWHYLWLGPHFLQVALAILLWRRGLYKVFPVFFTYVIFEAAEEFTLYAMDILPWVPWQTWWFAFCVGLIIEGALKLGVIGELFSHLLRSRPAISKVSTQLITLAGSILVFLAVLAAAYAPIDHSQPVWTYRGYVLLQSFYIVEGGLALFLFLFVAYSKLTWDRKDFGIALGFGILFCEHMATWSIMASKALPSTHYAWFDFLNLATYHICVLIWCYYLLVPQKKPTTSAVSLPEDNLAAWNRELERLIQQ